MSMMGNETLVDQELLESHSTRGTDLGVLMDAFDKTGVFYGVHEGENGGLILYIQQNHNHGYEVCEMKFNKHGSLERVDGMGI